MPELTIKCSNQKTLQILINLAETLDFKISKPVANGGGKTLINGVTLVSGDNTVDISDMNEIFTGKELDASNLRKQAWQRC